MGDESGSARDEPVVFPRVAAERSPWGVELLDLRPLTHTVTATSGDAQMAANAVSFGNEDGRAFLRAPRPEGPLVPASLRYPTDAPLADGVAFNPPDMDHKWAIYVLERRIVVVRSWQRRVTAVADVRQESDHVLVGPIRGSFGSRTDAAFTVCALDFLIRTHALGEAWPVPELVPADPEEHEGYALRAFASWGRRATVGAFAPFPFLPPKRPLRTDSALHISTARGDLAGIAAEVRAGVSPNLRARNGLPPLHWALMHERAEVLELLLALGADVNGTDDRGFTALHRAADTGHPHHVRVLLGAGADPELEAMGHTARGLAATRGHAEILAALDG